MTHTIIHNKQTGLEIEGTLVVNFGDTAFEFRIPGTNVSTVFSHEDWDIIDTPKEGVYAFATAQHTDPDPHTRVVKYRAGAWVEATGYETRDTANLQAAYELGELRRLTFATDN